MVSDHKGGIFLGHLLFLLHIHLFERYYVIAFLTGVVLCSEKCTCTSATDCI